MSATVPQTDLVTVTIDGVAVRVPKGTLLVEAAKSIHRDIPVYCYHEKLGPAGLCRVCLVEVEGMPKLQIACNTPVADGMKVHTTNPKVDDGRRAILEFFLLNHPLDCPICDKGGECDLQDYSMAYGQGSSRMVEPKYSKPKAVDLGPTIVLDEERCIVCQRCVRFDDVITQENSLRTDDRGAHTIIATATGKPYVSDFTGNVTELCPVGALTSKTYRFRSRPWDNHRTTTSCTQCAVGCQMHVDERGNTLLRTMSVTEDDALSDAWLCDRGRYGIGFVGDERRVTQPLLRVDGAWNQIGYDDAVALWADKLRAALAAGGPASVAVLGGGRLLNEEVALAAHLHRALGIENLDARVGAQRVVHHSSFASHVELENCDTIITLGRPPSQLAPVLDLRIRKAVARRGARLFSVGDHHARSFVPETHAADAAALRDAFPTGAKSIAVVWDGVPRADDGAFDAFIAELTSGEATIHSYVLPETPNGRGADALGLRPGPGGLDTRGILKAARDGKIAVLAILGANPMLRFPDRALVEAALRATPFVVVNELFLTETAELADLVLPVCSAFEKSGTTTDLAGDVLPVEGAVRPPADVLADGDVLVLLADALGVALPDPAELEKTVRAQVRSAPARLDPTPPAPAAAPAGGELRVVAETTIFTGGGTLAFDPALAELRARPRAALHPQTALALGVRDGDLVTVSAGAAALRDLTAVLDPRVPAGAVALLDGVLAAPLGALGSAPSVRLEKALVPA
ncbi:MAG: NADH-quinone oxidoreductase subunit [Candidatus Eremiobacteraeota bacterium]|nr:NADH-quinone oxidoreductase subunit [Candidatus Eremiobacteraeota bacterium]